MGEMTDESRFGETCHIGKGHAQLSCSVLSNEINKVKILHFGIFLSIFMTVFPCNKKCGTFRLSIKSESLKATFLSSVFKIILQSAERG